MFCGSWVLPVSILMVLWQHHSLPRHQMHSRLKEVCKVFGKPPGFLYIELLDFLIVSPFEVWASLTEESTKDPHSRLAMIGSKEKGCKEGMHFILGLLVDSPVIPAERRGPEREETWTLAPDHHDPCSFFDDISDIKQSKPVHDADSVQSRITVDESSEVPESGTLPRSQETRKSKTKKVKSYLRKCKGALSKSDEASSDKKRHEHCTSWYLDESHQEDMEVLFQKQSEFLDERIVEAEEASILIPDETSEDIANLPGDPPTNLAKDDGDQTGYEILSKLAEDDQRGDLRRSRTSLYEDARDSMNDRDCAVEETSCAAIKPERNDAVSLETLTTEDTNLNKCDSNDTLIAEVVVTGADGPPLVDVDEGKEEETRDQELDGETLRALSLVGVSRALDYTLCLLVRAVVVGQTQESLITRDFARYRGR
ncbi:hypothetical protein WN48_08634 [Eufriesea mexicana]|nr:hypothetical protein WN48_08634 [Eufriesea mexicana]